jgi:predicted small metal-binding protein
MAKEVTCPPCGAIIRGEDNAELIANVRQHSREHEHEMPAGMTDEQIDAHILSDAREVAST